MISRILVASAAAAFTNMAAARQASFMAFPDGIVARDVSADGSVVVGSTPSGAFRWTQQTGLVQIGTGIATSVSADGSVVTGRQNSGIFRWSAGAGQTTVMTGSGLDSVSKISGDGSTIVSGHKRWTAGTGMSQIPDPAGFAVNTMYAYDVSDDGSVIAGGFDYFTPTPQGAQPFRWSAATGSVALGSVPGQPADGSGNVVSGDGSVIAGLARTALGYDTFRWTQATGIVPLGAAGIGLTAPNPRAMTPDGQIMVGSAAFAAFVWRNGAGPEILQDVLEQHYGLDLGGFQLFSADGMSDDGRTIVGWGAAPSGATTGWVVHLPWSIPAPGTISVLTLAGIAVWRRRRS